MGIRYRPEVDGLRALAVIPVIFYHAGYEAFSGGFVGVDIFFVISGFLITGIIWRELEKRDFSIINFYERRARRILPALVVVCLACVPMAWLWMTPGAFSDFGESVISVFVFVSNIYFWLTTGYFDTAAELAPLLHTWSLGVEEQFYVFFPLLLMLLHRIAPKQILPVLIGMAVLSLIGAQWLIRTHPSAAFYLLPTRAWELAIGSILALTVGVRPIEDRRVAEIGSLLGMAMILFSIFVYTDALPFPGVWALPPVLGAALIIGCANGNTIIGRILSVKPIVFIGLISYSAYLWHQPLFAFARLENMLERSPQFYLGLSALSLVLAAISWRFVEQPFRRRDRVVRWQIFSGSGVAMAALIGFGAVSYATGGFASRFEEEAVDMEQWRREASSAARRCDIARWDEPYSRDTLLERCRLEPDRPHRLALWGDSHAIAVTGALARAARRANSSLMQLTYNTCPPVPGFHRVDQEDHCLEFNDDVVDLLAEGEMAETVVIVARWGWYYEASRFDNQEGGVERGGGSIFVVPEGEGRDYRDDPDRTQRLGGQFKRTIEGLLDEGVRVVLVYNIPEVGLPVPEYLAQQMRGEVERTSILSTSHEVFEERAASSYAGLDRIRDDPNLIRIYPEDMLCDVYVEGRCIAELDGKPLYYDDDHLSSFGAGMLVDIIVTAMEERGWIDRR